MFLDWTEPYYGFGAVSTKEVLPSLTADERRLWDALDQTMQQYLLANSRSTYQFKQALLAAGDFSRPTESTSLRETLQLQEQTPKLFSFDRGYIAFHQTCTEADGVRYSVGEIDYCVAPGYREGFAYSPAGGQRAMTEKELTSARERFVATQAVVTERGAPTIITVTEKAPTTLLWGAVGLATLALLR